MPRRPNPELVDEENPEWTEADLARARPGAEVLREQFGAAAEPLLKPKRGRPVKARRASIRQRRKSAAGKRRSKSRSVRA
jgi:uncharacterized protein (DUF4415 family)